MSKRKHKTRQTQNKKQAIGWPIWLGGVIVLLILAGGLIWAASGFGQTPLADLSADYPIGPTTTCQALPKFVEAEGLSKQVMIDTTQQRFIGVVLQDVNGQSYQHPSWDDAGNIGPSVLDRAGHIYVAPVAQVSLYLNPPDEQNKVYQINTDTGVMSDYINLPWPQPFSGQNPFGVVGLAYDCDTNSLYVASVAGSTREAELGRIYQIDLNSAKIVNQLDHVDALGVGVFNGSQGKRLYYGSARNPDVYSIALASNGEFVGSPRLEFSLAALEGGSYDNAHRIRFTRDNEMEIKGIEFDFRLKATSNPLRNIYLFNYNQTQDSWDLQSITLQ
jgi:hypothetical protein